MLKQRDNNMVPEVCEHRDAMIFGWVRHKRRCQRRPQRGGTPWQGAPCRATPRRAAPGLPGMSGQARVYRAVPTDPPSLTLGAVSSGFSPLWSPRWSKHLPLLRGRGVGSAGWPRAILQRRPQPSRTRAGIILAVPVSIWINATKVISVTGAACQRGRTAAGTNAVRRLLPPNALAPCQPCRYPGRSMPEQTMAGAGTKQRRGLGLPSSCWN